MLSKELLVEKKDNLTSLAENVDDHQIGLLVDWLKEKDNTIRYAAFLLLQLLSAKSNDVYRYWDIFVSMINNSNSYQRSLGLMLISDNIIWDKENRFALICDEYLEHCDDQKFITARQCIQGLNKILEYSLEYQEKIVMKLVNIELDKRKDTQRNLLLLDIINVLEKIKSNQNKSGNKFDEIIKAYLQREYEAANSNAKKVIRGLLNSHF